MAIKKTIGLLTLVAGISLIGLACEAAQARNGSNNPLSAACHQSCHSKQCIGTSVNKRIACTQCCDKKHKKNSIRHRVCINRCPK